MLAKCLVMLERVVKIMNSVNKPSAQKGIIKPKHKAKHQ